MTSPDIRAHSIALGQQKILNWQTPCLSVRLLWKWKYCRKSFLCVFLRACSSFNDWYDCLRPCWTPACSTWPDTTRARARTHRIKFLHTFFTFVRLFSVWVCVCWPAVPVVLFWQYNTAPWLIFNKALRELRSSSSEVYVCFWVFKKIWQVRIRRSAVVVEHVVSCG